MDKSQVKYNLFDLDKAINKMREKAKKVKKQQRLPRVYKKDDDQSSATCKCSKLR